MSQDSHQLGMIHIWYATIFLSNPLKFNHMQIKQLLNSNYSPDPVQVNWNPLDQQIMFLVSNWILFWIMLLIYLYILLKPILNGAHLTSATSAIAPPLFLPCPEIMYKYVLHFFCPAPNLFSTCTTTFKLQWAPICIVYNFRVWAQLFTPLKAVLHIP